MFNWAKTDRFFKKFCFRFRYRIGISAKNASVGLPIRRGHPTSAIRHIIRLNSGWFKIFIYHQFTFTIRPNWWKGNWHWFYWKFWFYKYWKSRNIIWKLYAASIQNNIYNWKSCHLQTNNFGWKCFIMKKNHEKKFNWL